MIRVVPSLSREWLEADGLGGFASGTSLGRNTRRYHGLLLAALSPPADRRVLVNDAVVWLARFDSGALGTFTASKLAAGHKTDLSFEINGSEGAIRWQFQ